MKIHYFGADYPPTGGGISTYSFEWIEAVSKQDQIESIKVLIFDNKNPREESLGEKVRVKTVSGINFLYVGLKVFQRFWSMGDFDIFHSFNLFPVGFWVVFWGKVFRKKTIVSFYGTDANDTSGSFKTFFLKKYTFKNASSMITISEYTKQATLMKYGLNEKSIKVIYPVVPSSLLYQNQGDDQEIRKTYNLSDSDFVIVSVCRLVKRKGVEFLIQAISKIKDQNIHLFVIGNGKEKDGLVKLVSDLGLEKTVHILGKVKDIVPFYKIANVSTLVSYTLPDDGDFEGLGLVLLEAQSYGVPVIGSRSGGIPEAFEDKVTGIVVEPRNVDEIANAILKMKNDREYTKLLAKNTKVFLESRFGVKNTVIRYIELCSSL